MSDAPCAVCGATDHERVQAFGVTVLACPHASVDRPVMYAQRPKDAASLGFPRFDRPPREVYVRTSRPTVGGDFVEPGVEFREGDDFKAIEDALRSMLVDHDPGRDERDPVRIAAPVEAAIKERWPDRAYFVEVHGKDGWIQIFQPWGIPRNR